jgi:hypothetical protein
MGSRLERRFQLPSARFLERYRPVTTHHMEGTLSSSTRRRVVSNPTQGQARPPTRGQQGNGRRTNQAYLPVTRFDDRATPLVVPTRHQRHPHPPSLHPVNRERVGRHTQPRTRHGGVATQPLPIRTPSGPVGPPYYRPVRFHAKHPAPAVQRPVESPTMRGCRLLTHARRGMATREQLLQPSLNRPTITRRQARPIASPGNRRRPLLAQQDMVPRSTSPRRRDHTLPGVPGSILSRRARHARGGRTARVEHRGLSAYTPSWLYTRRGAIGRALRPAQVGSTTPPIISPRTGPPRYRLHMDSAPLSSTIA